MGGLTDRRRPRRRAGSIRALISIELTYCVVTTEQRQLLGYCLDAIARERAAVDFETETLVLDNASRDGSADAARAHSVTTDVIAPTAGARRARTRPSCCGTRAGASACC